MACVSMKLFQSSKKEAACKVLAVRGYDSEGTAVNQTKGASNVPALTSAMRISQAFITQDPRWSQIFPLALQPYKGVQSMCAKLQCSSHRMR